MKVHHLNCATLCPYGGSLVSGEGGLTGSASIICHCLLVESGNGLILVDTGFGTGDIANKRQLGFPFTAAFRPQLETSETAIERVKALGFDPGDVRHIVVTHLDLDHAGGLPDFPAAEVHVHETEHAAAMKPSLRERQRYIRNHFAHDPKWATHKPDGEKWFGFESVRAVPDSDDEILLVPLHGHSRGHCGVAVKSADGWLINCGDSYFHHGEMEDPHHCPAGLAVFQRLMAADLGARKANQERLRELKRDHGDGVTLFSAHDPVEFARAAQQ